MIKKKAMSKKTLLEQIDYFQERMNSCDGDIQTLLGRIKHREEKKKSLGEKVDYLKKEFNNIKK